ncbi:MAG: hypothetical protein GY722_16400 [bacterium]|nr:hypothetical protein [bacterium]
MPRDPRYLPPGWSVEVTTRTICGFYLLPATPHFARVMVGILARAQEKYPVKVHAAVAASNHYHLILTPDDADQLGDFMEYVNGNLARETNHLLDEWSGPVWTDRFHHIPISPEPEALVERLRYVLSNTIKENLVARIRDWEGLHDPGCRSGGLSLQHRPAAGAAPASGAESLNHAIHGRSVPWGIPGGRSSQQ